MGLETASHIAGLNAANPAGATDLISEGDNHIRMIKQALTTDFSLIDGPVGATDTDLSSTAYLADTGVANALIAAPTPAWTGYTAGCGLWIKAAQANTGATTINVSGLGLKSIKRPDGTDLQSGDIAANAVIGLRYDGTQFQLLSGVAALTQSRADNRYLQSNGMKTVKLSTDTTTVGEWVKIARIQLRNPVDALEDAVFSGFAFVQSDYNNTSDGQSLFQFSFGVRGGSIKPVCVQMGDNFGANKFAIYRESDGWHYLYLYRGLRSKYAVIQYHAQDCAEYWTVQSPSGVLVWDSINNAGQALSNGKNLIWDDETAAISGWINVTDFRNGWTDYTVDPQWPYPSFCKGRDGIVRLRGVIRGGGTASGTAMLALPAGYRPAQPQIFVCANNSLFKDIRVLGDGTVTYGYVGVGDSVWLALDPIQFRAEQ